MTLKSHILDALREQALRWEELLLNLSEVQITTHRFDLDWSIQDVVAHLWGWQQDLDRPPAGRRTRSRA